MTDNIIYQVENDLTAQEYRDLLIKSTLGLRRPVQDMDKIEKMCRNVNLIITARIGNQLVGAARTLTDFVYSTYLCDLAVDEAYQHKGIGKRLIIETKLQTPLPALVLLAAPAAVNYYPKIGMKNFEHCFLLKDVADLDI